MRNGTLLPSPSKSVMVSNTFRRDAPGRHQLTDMHAELFQTQDLSNIKDLNRTCELSTRASLLHPANLSIQLGFVSNRPSQPANAPHAGSLYIWPPTAYGCKGFDNFKRPRKGSIAFEFTHPLVLEFAR